MVRYPHMAAQLGILVRGADYTLRARLSSSAPTTCQKLSTKDRECLIINVAILMAQDGRTKPGARKKPGRKLRGR